MVGTPFHPKGGLDLAATMDKDPELTQKLSPFYDPKTRGGNQHNLFFLWSDRNGDQTPQAAELQVMKIKDRFTGAIYFGRDLSITTTTGIHLPPPAFTRDGIPEWDLNQMTFLTERRDPQEGYAASCLYATDGYFIVLGRVPAGRSKGIEIAGLYGPTTTTPQASRSSRDTSRVARSRWATPSGRPAATPARCGHSTARKGRSS